MAIDIKFDLTGNPEPPTIILANRNGNKLGQLKVNEDSIDLVDKFNDASEISFTVNKYINGELTPLWDKLLDFKLIYCKEWDLWFEATVELDEETESVKTVFCTQLGQAELSQIMLYNIEINTEDDIARDDYKISILYDEENPKASILNRVLEKAPHYSIAHVDPTIAGIQRTFSFDGTSIYDAFQEVAEEIGCLFVYNSNSDEEAKIQRSISVYDLQQNCNECGHRGDFTEVCPKCDSTDINYNETVFKDTLIFVTSDELAAKGIELKTDTDAVKNCFKLEAGDDLMTATIRNCNPNGTDYIWYFSDAVKEDMTKELVEKIESYDAQYSDYYKNYESNIDEGSLSEYNTLVNKYSEYNEDLQEITSPIVGYPNLMNAYYNTIDLDLYLKSGLMPNVEMSETSASEQSSLLTADSLSPVAVNTDYVESISVETANSAILSMAKIIVKPTYKVEINDSTIEDVFNDEADENGEYKFKHKLWTGKFIITNYSNEEDSVVSDAIEVTVNNDTETFVRQKLDKALNKENTDDLSISGLFKKDYNEFCAELKKYALNPLKSFYDACDSCLNILIDQGAADKNVNPDLYENLYKPYYDKSSAITEEIKLREEEITIIEGVYDKTDENNPILITKGLQQCIEECRNTIQNALDFEKYLGEELWLEFCAYRREDTYSNDNYISDGLNNAELFKKASEFYEVAQNEIYKSSELQHSISTSLNNLLAIDKFKTLVDSFNVGNWIRVQVDDKVFKLRLLEYEIDFGNFNNISVEFSDVTKIKNGITDLESVFSQASSMATSYSSIQRQAEQGNEAKGSIDQWITKGLNSAIVRIQNNDNEEVTFAKDGLLCRSYNDITETYSPEQFKLTHNIMAYTTDNWETVSAALGKHNYTKWVDNQWVEDVGYGFTSKFVTAGYITGSQFIGGEIVSDNYVPNESGTYFDLRNGDFEIAGGNIAYNTDDKSLTLKNVTIEWSNSNTPEIKDITGIEEYLDQIDGKAQIFTSTPTPPYFVGDLWVQGTKGDIRHCVASKSENEFYSEDDWALSSKYTDDSSLNTFINNSYAADLQNIQSQIDNKAEVWYQNTDPSSSWEGNTDDETNAIKATHIGDLWHCTDDIKEGNTVIRGKNSEWIWQSINGSYDWVAMDVPDAVFDKIDGIASIYVEIPDNPVKGDLLIPTTTITTSINNVKKVYGQGKVYRYDGSSWLGINYTDNTVANKIATGIGATEIDEQYVISPHIVGGDLKIVSVDGTTSAEISSDGVLTATGANISGTITATDGSFTGTVYATDSTFSGTIESLNQYKDYVRIENGLVKYGSDSSNVIAAQMGYDQTGGFYIETLNDVDLYIGSDNGLTVGSMRMGATGNIAFYNTVDDAKNNTNMRGYIGFSGGKILNIKSDQNAIVMEASSFYPYKDNSVPLGVAGSRWTNVYANNGTIQTSDRNLKKDITELDEKYVNLFDGLRPVSFGFTNPNSDRTHIGFISQDVKEKMDEVGLTEYDFAGYCRDIKTIEDEETGEFIPVLDENGCPEYIYSLRYQEFIALNTRMIQENRKIIASQAEEIQFLKDRITALENAL